MEAGGGGGPSHFTRNSGNIREARISVLKHRDAGFRDARREAPGACIRAGWRRVSSELLATGPGAPRRCTAGSPSRSQAPARPRPPRRVPPGPRAGSRTRAGSQPQAPSSQPLSWAWARGPRRGRGRRSAGAAAARARGPPARGAGRRGRSRSATGCAPGSRACSCGRWSKAPGGTLLRLLLVSRSWRVGPAGRERPEPAAAAVHLQPHGSARAGARGRARGGPRRPPRPTAAPPTRASGGRAADSGSGRGPGRACLPALGAAGPDWTGDRLTSSWASAFLRGMGRARGREAP